eukprot:44125-Eustigmatos_ZCMA.PRE.1
MVEEGKEEACRLSRRLWRPSWVGEMRSVKRHWRVCSMLERKRRRAMELLADRWMCFEKDEVIKDEMLQGLNRRVPFASRK